MRSETARPGGVAVHREEAVVAPVPVAAAGLGAALARKRAERLARPDAAAAADAVAAAAAAVGQEAVGVAGVARRRRLGRHSAIACQKDC